MPRSFVTHPARSRIELSGVWAFRVGAADAAAEELIAPPVLGADSELLPVPGVWEATLAHYRHRGLGWYARTFHVPPDRAGPARLVFEAVSHTATVWLDGRKLGGHYGAHTAFEFQLPRIDPGEHQLAVLVDNRFGPHNPLTTARQDIYTWGGISRPVWLEFLPAISIAEGTAVPRRQGDRWSVEVRVQLARAGASPWPAEARVTIGEQWSATIAIGADGSGATSIAVERPELWSPRSPRLYFVTIAIAQDVWRERIGFRAVEARGRELRLNGEPLWLQGVNRHEFHPDFGPALPPALHLRDLEILKRLGANFVRGSHYPNDAFFLDLCDEHGIVFWEELSHWQPDEAEMKEPAFLAASLAQAEEMICQHRHHPSILFWGLMNEAELHKPVAREIIAPVARRARELDGTRLIVVATDKPHEDVTLDLVDVTGLNFYPGWYHSDLSGAAAVGREWIETLARRAGEKPILISEFGAAAIDGARSFEDRKWTENYQARLIEEVIAMAEATGLVSGVCIWQFCDVRSSPERAMVRAREYNNKGIVTEYREPKLAFFAVERLFRRGRPARHAP